MGADLQITLIALTGLGLAHVAAGTVALARGGGETAPAPQLLLVGLLGGLELVGFPAVFLWGVAAVPVAATVVATCGLRGVAVADVACRTLTLCAALCLAYGMAAGA